MTNKQLLDELNECHDSLIITDKITTWLSDLKDKDQTICLLRMLILDLQQYATSEQIRTAFIKNCNTYKYFDV